MLVVVRLRFHRIENGETRCNHAADAGEERDNDGDAKPNDDGPKLGFLGLDSLPLGAWVAGEVRGWRRGIGVRVRGDGHPELGHLRSQHRLVGKVIRDLAIRQNPPFTRPLLESDEIDRTVGISVCALNRVLHRFSPLFAMELGN